MDDKTQKERLEQELRFLKESFDAEVISKDEFEKGKDRIEKKLKEIQGQEKNKEQIAQKPELKTEQKKEDITEKREEEKIKLKVIQDEAEEHEHFELIQEQKENVHEEQKPLIEESKSDGKFFKYAVIFVVLVLVVFFSYSFIKNKPSKETQETAGIKFVAACSSNDDCKQEGKAGTCLNPGTKDARCEFKELPKTKVTVLNDRKNCFNCDTSRVLDILENWFGSLDVKEIDYNTAEGKNLSEKIEARLLPVYLVAESAAQKPSFEQFSQAFVKKDMLYVLNDDAAGSTFYFRRENIPNKLDFFVIPNDATSIKAENNLKEFLDNFKEVKFEKHSSTGKLAQELGLKNFPTFLINNRIKFSGIQPAETIKTNFCKVNKLKECEKTLSRNLV